MIIFLNKFYTENILYMHLSLDRREAFSKMKKKILATVAVFSFGLANVGHATTTFAATDSLTTSEIQEQKQNVFSKTIGDTSGQLIFSQVGDTLKVESGNNGKSVSAKGDHWSVRVNGKEIFSFFETAKVEQVVQAFNKLPQEKKKGQQFEIVQNVHKTDWQEIGNEKYYFLENGEMK
ncbi:hypothetical protein IIQ_00028 [Bacillus cereus VD118]|uniref:Uncharacterized protein n=2 Tax=Bacillus TaxID=1386 RepID=R8QM83_BACCE|nr:hypothetical protein IIQ_00028 [Bacillus cereus VD118]MBJ8095565.1 hypothetical protein [Bacillus cereus]CAH2464495.1 hypothetical protein ACOSJ1_EBGNOMHC_05029 [Bacillus mycoides KBAB4]